MRKYNWILFLLFAGEETRLTLRLRIPTNRTIEGPILKMTKDRLVVDYDFEQDDGLVQWGRLVFEDVLTFKYCDTTCSSPESVLPSTEIRVLDSSGYLDSARLRWSKSVGWQDWQKEMGGASRYRHFTLFFDDAGSLDVVAARLRDEHFPAAVEPTK